MMVKCVRCRNHCRFLEPVAFTYYQFCVCSCISVICVVSRQDERESELRDENSKLHTKYTEVIPTWHDVNYDFKICLIATFQTYFRHSNHIYLVIYELK